VTRHVVPILLFDVVVHEGMVLDVGVNLIDGPVGLTFGHSVDEVVLHELVALDDPPGFFRRHHRGPEPRVMGRPF